MSRQGSLWSIATLAVLLALSWGTSDALERSATRDASAPDDASGAPADYHVVRLAPPRAPSGLGDMLQPLGKAAPVATPRAAAGPRPAATELANAPQSSWSRVAVWERLAALSPSQRVNAVIELELGGGAGPADRLAASRIQGLWNEGLHDEAIAELHSFETAGGRTALGIAWKEPVAPAGELATAAGGGDVRIGTRTGGRLAALDFDTASGALFAVVGWGATTGGEAWWTVNRSTNDGASWSETYSWYAGLTGGLIDMSATVVGGYVYVGYVEGDVASEYRLRRCHASTGAVDATYGYKVVVDAGALTIREVTVVSNARSGNNRVYCFAIQSDNAVRFFWAVASSGTAFTEASPAGASARTGLDASWNPGYATCYLHLCYAGTDDEIHVQRYSTGGGWDDVTLLSSASVTHRSGVTISSYHDVVICAYEYQMTQGVGITYGISYDGGATGWDLYNYVFEPDGVTVGSYQCPSVDTHNGVGCAIIASGEMGEPDAVYCRKRAVFAPGVWEDQWPFNDHDVLTGTPTTLAHVPVLDPGMFSLGAIYFFGSTPYFDLPMLGTADVPGSGPAAGVRLDPPAPSPFTDHATVRFTLTVAGPARLEVFNVHGRRVATVTDGPMEAGTHSFPLDGRVLGSGVYFCRLTAGPAEQVSRFVILH